MHAIYRGGESSLALHRGERLTITGTPDAAGTLCRLTNLPGETCTNVRGVIKRHPIEVGQTVEVGPFAENRRYIIECHEGLLKYRTGLT